MIIILGAIHNASLVKFMSVHKLDEFHWAEFCLINQIHSLEINTVVHILDVQSPTFRYFNNIIFAKILWDKKWFIFLFCFNVNHKWPHSEIYTFSWTTLTPWQETNVGHISDFLRSIFCLYSDAVFIKTLKEKLILFFVSCGPHIVTFWKKIFNFFHDNILLKTIVNSMCFMWCKLSRKWNAANQNPKWLASYVII